jgi:hypothetical protein
MAPGKIANFLLLLLVFALAARLAAEDNKNLARIAQSDIEDG